MRWQGQTIDDADAAALPGLENRTGIVRSVTTPEFAGMTFHEVLARSALNKVPGGSRMPFSWTINPYRGCSHACVYCVSPDTQVLCADGRHRPIIDLQIGDEIIGTERQGDGRRYVRTTILAKWDTQKATWRVTLADGTTIVASGDHRFLTDRGWKHVADAESGQRPHLTPNNRLMGFGIGAPAGTPVDMTSDAYRHGYLAGMTRGDGMVSRTRTFLEHEGISTHLRPFTVATDARPETVAIHTASRSQVEQIEEIITVPIDPDRAWRTGFLAGIFDANGSCSRGVLRISNKDTEILHLITSSMTALGIPHVSESPKANGAGCIRVVGGLSQRQRFFDLTQPVIASKLSVEGQTVESVADLRVVTVEPLGETRDLIDITTGTGDFIANGVISHNCFARGTHEYLDLDGGGDFDSQIVVKTNVAEVLAKELRRGSWKHESVALGTNTDPYQRAEGRYKLMPDIIRTLAESGTPFSILTKGTLIRRDIPLLVDAAKHVPIDVQMSIAMYDDALQHSIEPGTPSTQARLDTVRALTDAGFRVGVFLMPVLPHLTDSVAAIDQALQRIDDAGADHVVYGALHLRAGVKPWFMQWLQREHPELMSSYRGLYPGTAADAPKPYRQWLAKRVRPLIRAHGLDVRHSDDAYPTRRLTRPAPVSEAVVAAPAPMLF